ncbi:hypothetical protein K4K49_006492 [Colletotrichum sp. SAR 10_70]|nr:hypothetical protein K4K50_011911 [Colletotrichum sp. SAR 10_71]KAI8204013.1 hypothetical protein K4K49_006492 [Colletotrichum sp. SAR 10_70]KAI8260921.1 hypothetical protein K4K53_001287 [Colletotrichum sp. SAR 10_77]
MQCQDTEQYSPASTASSLRTVIFDDSDSYNSAAPSPKTVNVYDEDWYIRNTREHPDPEVVEANIGNAKRGKDESALYIARQKNGRPHAVLAGVNMPKPPPKGAYAGRWNYIEFVPEWNDPLWVDPQLEIDEEDPHKRLVRPKDLLRYLRPAQRPEDQIRKPTAMALRFGIFPMRQDGRSRMTPTRSTFRQFTVNGTANKISGEDVAREAEELAKNWGDDSVEALLERYASLDPSGKGRLSEESAFVLNAMRSMQEDEDWQRILFLGATTNELLDHGVLSFGSDSRITLKSPVHRMPVPESRDDRPQDQRDRWPLFTFSKKPDPLPPGGQPFIPPEYYQLLDPIETTANVLNDWLVLNITSTFHTENEAEGQPLNGITFAEDDGTIRTCLGADDIYPLLVQGYTTDERLVFSFRVATTLVHEIAHAVTYAHRNWMHSPGPSTLPIISGHPAVENSIASIGKLLFAHQRTPEPFFEQEQRCEVGFSLENHLYGGTAWPLIGRSSHVHPKHLYSTACGLTLYRWPRALHQDPPGDDETRKDPSDAILKTPVLVSNQYATFISVAQVLRFFTEEWWTTEIPRFGSAAMRLNTDMPTRILPPPDRTMPTFEDADLLPKQWDLWNEWPDDLLKTNPLVYEFLMSLTQEHLNLACAKAKWQVDYLSWKERQWLLLNTGAQANIIVIEAVIGATYRRNLVNMTHQELQKWKDEALLGYQNTLARFSKRMQGRKLKLPAPSLNLANADTFWENIGTVAQGAGRRLAELLRTYFGELQYELHTIMGLYLDIFNLGDEDRIRFTVQPVIRTLKARAQTLASLHEEIITLVNQPQATRMYPGIAEEFRPMFERGFETTKYLFGWSGEITRIKLENWALLLPLIPNIHIAHRPSSARLFTFARREIELLPAKEFEAVQNYVCTIQNATSHTKQAINTINADSLKRDVDYMLRGAVSRIKDIFGGVLHEASDEALDSKVPDVGERPIKRVKYNPPSLEKPMLVKASTAAAARKSGFTIHDSKKAQSGRRRASVVPQSHPTAFSNTHQSQGKPSVSGVSTIESHPPKLPTADIFAIKTAGFAPMAGVEHTGSSTLAPSHPASVNLFAAPYALTGTLTGDLVREAEMMEERRHALFTNKHTGEYRDPKGNGLDSPETPKFVSRFPNPNDGTP